MAKEKRAKSKEGGDGFSFLEWLPWEKLTIWAIFLLLVYSLRSFFFIVFMTFIIAYTMRGLVDWLAKKISPDAEKAWLHRLLTVGCFLGLLLAGYGSGSYLWPKLKEQVEDKLLPMANELTDNPAGKLDEVLRDTLGHYLAGEEYGSAGDEAYDQAFEEYKKQGLHYKEFGAFQKERQRLEALFEAGLVKKRAAEALERELSTGSQEDRLLVWILDEDYDAVLGKKRGQYDAKRKRISEEEGLKIEPFDKLSPEDQRSLVEDYVRKEILPSEKALAPYRERWRKRREVQGLDSVRKLKNENPGEYRKQFAAFYKKTYKAGEEPDSENDPEAAYKKFTELSAALDSANPLQAFSKAFDGDAETGERTDEELRAGFELKVRADALEEWKQGKIAQEIGNFLVTTSTKSLTRAGTGMGDVVKQSFYIAVGLGLSLLLSFFIVFDLTKMRRGVRRLQSSRVKDFYLEIAPGLISFGRLIGRAFQAQAVIAFFNTVLTFLLIRILGIDNPLFLCVIVFFCSFIPVLGVVLSSIPIALIAIAQPDGGVWLAFLAVVGILLIHLVEAWILNPKILGDMLHLHPVMVLAILAIGEHFFGVWGLLLGVPVIVYILRFVILDEGIPGIIEPIRPEDLLKAGEADAAAVELAAAGAGPDGE
ncbi:MAG: AI-2E family transporter [Planctomycetes bacterium]|nr:AI-2E family transporter [Planctomycetota bacterium]